MQTPRAAVQTPRRIRSFVLRAGRTTPAQQRALKNLRVICSDAVDVLQDYIADASFDEMLVFFPDPWHKKRHHKRRLIEPSFVALAAAKLRGGGTLRLATDWQGEPPQKPS